MSLWRAKQLEYSFLRALMGLAAYVDSNGSPAMLHAAVSGAGLAECFQAVLSVDAVRTYELDLRVYQLALEALGRPAAELPVAERYGCRCPGATGGDRGDCEEHAAGDAFLDSRKPRTTELDTLADVRLVMKGGAIVRERGGQHQ